MTAAPERDDWHEHLAGHVPAHDQHLAVEKARSIDELLPADVRRVDVGREEELELAHAGVLYAWRPRRLEAICKASRSSPRRPRTRSIRSSIDAPGAPPNAPKDPIVSAATTVPQAAATLGERVSSQPATKPPQ